MHRTRCAARNIRRAIGALVLLGAIGAGHVAAQPGAGQPAATDRVDVWVQLTQPSLSSLPPGADRDAQRARIDAEQAEVMAALRALGAVELARVQVVRNALAVQLPRAQIDAARRLPGVRSIGPVRHIQRQPPPDPQR